MDVESLSLLIPILAILLGPVMYWMHIKDKQVGIASDLAAEKATHYATRIAELEQRLRVVERIVTDGGLETAAQIDALRPPALSREKTFNA